jgi:hypothetical protein
MKQRVKLHNETSVLFEGRISDVPIKPDAIVEKSIELFGDDDPCVIHQSYVIKSYADQLLERFQHDKTHQIHLSKHGDLAFLDVPDGNWILELLGNK